MTRTLIYKSIRDSWLLLASCAIGLIVFCWVRVWIVSQIEVARFKTILENLPETVQRLIPVPIQDLLTYEGRIAYGFEEPIVYLIMAIWTIARGSDVVSGEMGRGTLEMLAAQPISRSHWMSSHGLVTASGAIVLALAALGGTLIGVQLTSASVVSERMAIDIPLLDLQIPLSVGKPPVEQVPMRELVNERLLPIAAANYAALGFFLAGLAMCVSAADRYRWRTIGIVIGFYITQSLIELLAHSLDSVWLRRLTFLSAYEPVGFVTRAMRAPETAWQFWSTVEPGPHVVLGPLGGSLLLVGMGSVLFAIGLAILARRDLAAPL